MERYTNFDGFDRQSIQMIEIKGFCTMKVFQEGLLKHGAPARN